MSGIEFPISYGSNNTYNIQSEDTSEDVYEDEEWETEGPTEGSETFAEDQVNNPAPLPPGWANLFGKMMSDAGTKASKDLINDMGSANPTKNPSGSLTEIVPGKNQTAPQALPQASFPAGKGTDPIALTIKLSDPYVTMQEKENIVQTIYKKASPVEMEQPYITVDGDKGELYSDDYRSKRSQDNYVKWMFYLVSIATDKNLPVSLRLKAANYVIASIYHDNDPSQPVPANKVVPGSKEACIKEEIDRRTYCDSRYADQCISSLMLSDIAVKDKQMILDRYYQADPNHAIVLIAKCENTEGLKEYVSSKVSAYIASAATNTRSTEVIKTILTNEESGTGCRLLAFDHLAMYGGPDALAFLKDGKWLLVFGTAKLEDVMASSKLDIGFKLNFIAAYMFYCEKANDTEGYQLAASMINKEGMRPALAKARRQASGDPARYAAYDRFIGEGAFAVAMVPGGSGTTQNLANKMQLSPEVKLIDAQIELIKRAIRSNI